MMQHGGIMMGFAFNKIFYQVDYLDRIWRNQLKFFLDSLPVLQLIQVENKLFVYSLHALLIVGRLDTFHVWWKGISPRKLDCYRCIDLSGNDRFHLHYFSVRKQTYQHLILCWHIWIHNWWSSQNCKVQRWSEQIFF